MKAGAKTTDSDAKLRRLQSVTDAALSRLDVEDLLVELLDRTRDLLDVDTAAVLLLDSSGEQLVATAARGIEEEVRQGLRLPVGRGFAGRIAASGQVLRIEHVDHTNVINPILIDKSVVSVLGVPMISSGRIIGVLHVGSLEPRRFSDDDVELLQLVADRASIATIARLARLDHATTVALQHSLLPARPSRVAGLDVAARYVPGAEVGVGGDWYDLFALPSGHVGVVIGDVVGHGLRAAVVMGRIRSALRAYSLESNDPADVLTRLDHKMQVFEPDAMATVIYGVIDPARDSLTLSVAGHPPPAVAEPGRATRMLDMWVDAPVGAVRDARRRNTVEPLMPGTTMLFFTDGLIERRNRSLDEGFGLILAALTPSTADEACVAVMGALVDDQPVTDDVALLALHRTTSSF